MKGNVIPNRQTSHRSALLGRGNRESVCALLAMDVASVSCAAMAPIPVSNAGQLLWHAIMLVPRRRPEVDERARQTTVIRK